MCLGTAGRTREVNVRLKESEPEAYPIVPKEIRWLAIITGGFVAVAGFFALGPYFLMYCSFLIVGAIAQTRFPRWGRWLMWAGSLILILWALPLGVDTVRMWRAIVSRQVTALILVSVLLVLVCDVALVIEALRARRDRLQNLVTDGGTQRGDDLYAASDSPVMRTPPCPL